jgi:TetR/AcrR family transcriptional regulator, mexJK operon transcriptional repressor
MGAHPDTRVETIPIKRRQILAAACELFGELGFERASVDLIASRAGVSKATVYNHFDDKQALFVAAVLSEADEMRAELQRCLAQAPDDVEHALQAIGEKLMVVFLSPSIAGLYRHVVAEVARLPEIGRMVFERGTQAIQMSVAAHLARWNDSGTLRIDDPRSAAIAFVALCQGDLAARSRLGVLTYPVDDQIRDTVRRAVRIFVRAYRP